MNGLRICTVVVAAFAAAAVHADVKQSPTAAALEETLVARSASDLPGPDFATWLAREDVTLTHLKPDWESLLPEFEKLGEVSVVTANDCVAHAGTGSYTPFRMSGPHALVLDKAIDLRLFVPAWRYGVAIARGQEETAGFVFFDEYGAPVHRLLLTDGSDGAVFDGLIESFAGAVPEFSAPAAALPVADRSALSEEKAAAFMAAWSALEDTHDFSGLLEEHGVSRVQALAAAEGVYTEHWDAGSQNALFQQIVDQNIGVLVFVSNEGSVQIHGGTFDSFHQEQGTLRLSGDHSELFVAGEHIADVWRVSKPTARGVAHSVELYNERGDVVAYVFGSRKGDDDGSNMAAWESLIKAPETVSAE